MNKNQKKGKMMSQILKSIERNSQFEDEVLAPRGPCVFFAGKIKEINTCLKHEWKEISENTQWCKNCGALKIEKRNRKKPYYKLPKKLR